MSLSWEIKQASASTGKPGVGFSQTVQIFSCFFGVGGSLGRVGGGEEREVSAGLFMLGSKVMLVELVVERLNRTGVEEKSCVLMMGEP